MKTKIIKINPIKPEKSKIKKAAYLIKKGELVAFPTETVYGLGADALNPTAVKKIFKVKKRKSDNPLIVHISNIKQVEKLTKNFPQSAKILAKKFWPGPLTIVLKKSKLVPDVVTAGLDSVAIRMPKNKIALSLINNSKKPIAAPSANSSGKPSPTKAEHVFSDLKFKIPLILDGGQTQIGIESTVVDLTSRTPKILRPGKITKKQIENTLKIKVIIAKTSSKKPSSPGMKYKHYSPNAKVILIKNPTKEKIQNVLKGYSNKKIGLITNKKYKLNCKMFYHPSLKKLARELFSNFREFDKNKYDIIVVCAVPEDNFGLAIMNRLKKAASKIIN